MGLETQRKLKTTACLEIISNTDANLFNLHIGKARKTHDDKQLYLITHFTKQSLNLNYWLLTLNVRVELLNSPKIEKVVLFLNLNFRAMMTTSSFGSLSILLYTSDLKCHWIRISMFYGLLISYLQVHSTDKMHTLPRNSAGHTLLLSFASLGGLNLHSAISFAKQRVPSELTNS